jgi:DNA-binding response OmpR family regulator
VEPENVNPAPVVLVVDDDRNVQGLIASLLSTYGYQVVVAGDGRDAMRRLLERCPGLILLDLNMPVLDGWAFRRDQRYATARPYADVPVVLMSGLDHLHTQADWLRASGFLKKPFLPDDVLTAVSAAIASHRSASGSAMIPPDTLDGGTLPPHMDAHRMERIVREIVAEYGFPCELIGVHDREGTWHVTVRHQTRRIIDFDVVSTTPTRLRELIVARLESEC